MTAVPDDHFDDDPGHDAWGDWDDEWDREAWGAFSLFERGERDDTRWGSWVLQLVAVALVLPFVLGALVAILIALL